MLRGEMVWAAGLLALSGATDFLDGFLARRFGWISNLGKVLDPIADKLTQIAVCVLFAMVLAGWFWAFLGFLVFKELMMLALGLYLLGKDVKIEGAYRFGKVTTFSFYAIMILIALFPAMPSPATYALLGAVCVLALITGLRYIPAFRAYRAQLKEARK